jgi:hypothetical protein
MNQNVQPVKHQQQMNYAQARIPAYQLQQLINQQQLRLNQNGQVQQQQIHHNAQRIQYLLLFFQ